MVLKKEDFLNTRRQGYQGEDIACDHLKGLGYRILQTNFYTPVGEIDIIALYESILIGVEVKRVTSLRFLSPLYKISKKKQDRIRLSMLCYCQCLEVSYDLRFDVIVILDKEVYSHLESAF